MRRRRFIATGAGVGAGLLAGCTGSNDSGGTDGTSDDSTMDDSNAVGAFRLLISDQPAAIGDFDSLDVSFSKTRIFHAGENTETETVESPETGTAEPTETADVNDGEDEDDKAEADGNDDRDGEGSDGFVVRELDGVTVDLTKVVGDKAISVLDGELEAGRYSKIELYAESVDGVVDGESVNVKVPSGKLQIIESFEVVAGESVDFVFDINVVKKGNGGYNLLPVISESGVSGKDVEVEEVDEGGDADDETTAVETTPASDQGGNETTAGE
ncbi:MAG: DUF4382 domain-containing protein [Haloarcula sp.]